MAQGRYPVQCPQCGGFHSPACPPLDEIWAKAAELRAARDTRRGDSNPQHTADVFAPRVHAFGFGRRKGLGAD